MWPAISILAGVLMQQMQEAEARKQAKADIYMNHARSRDPRRTPTAAYDAQKFNNQLESQRGQMVAQLLPLALKSAISEKPAPEPVRGPQLTKPALISGLQESQEVNPFGLPRHQIDFPSLALSNDPASQYSQLTEPQLRVPRIR